MTKIVILTGPIASGKSTVRKLVSSYGIPVLDADLVVHDAYKNKSSQIYKNVHAIYGDEILDSNGYISRPKLREIVSTKDELHALEQAVTNEVKVELLNATNLMNTPYVLWEVPLYKRGWFDNATVLTVVSNKQKELFLKRGNSTEDAFELISNHQLSIDAYKALADVVIENNGSLEDLEKVVLDIHYALMEDA